MREPGRRPTLLVTGFGPFPRMPRNPSAAAACAVAALPCWRRLGIDARALVLTTAYRAIAAELEPALAAGPNAVLMVGVAGRSIRVRVEIRATPRRSTLFPDAEGTSPGRALPAMRGPDSRRSRLPGEKARLAFRQHQVPVRISRDAGRYLCNASYHAALAHPTPAIFIHMPLASATPRPVSARRPSRLAPAVRFTQALAAVAGLLLRQR